MCYKHCTYHNRLVTKYRWSQLDYDFFQKDKCLWSTCVSAFWTQVIDRIYYLLSILFFGTQVVYNQIVNELDLDSSTRKFINQLNTLILTSTEKNKHIG